MVYTSLICRAFRGFPQFEDEDYYPDIAGERRACDRSEKGREELRSYLPAIRRYTSKAEYVIIEGQVNGLMAIEALDVALIAQDQVENTLEELTPSAIAELRAKTSDNAPAESTSIAENIRYKCPQCDTTLKNVRYLNTHMEGHKKQHQCRFCPQRFGRQDQVPRHELWQHGQNSSSHVCYIAYCFRVRVGMKNEPTLVRHLQKYHGATMDDNEKARLEQGYEQDENHRVVQEHAESEEGSPSVETETSATDTESDDDRMDFQQEVTSSYQEVAANDQDHEDIHASYEAVINRLHEQLREEREFHRAEIANIRKGYKAQIEDLKAQIAAGNKEQGQI
ncbi:hypothetical protein PG984_005166 [Apiospora sp. TS-2023a]